MSNEIRFKAYVDHLGMTTNVGIDTCEVTVMLRGIAPAADMEGYRRLVAAMEGRVAVSITVHLKPADAAKAVAKLVKADRSRKLERRD